MRKSKKHILIKISSNFNDVFDFGFKSGSDCEINKELGLGRVLASKIGVESGSISSVH